MLEALRRGIGTWFAKIFIALLVLSFAVWGIADIFGGYGEQTVVKVGEIEISSQTYQSEFNREIRALSNRLGRDLSTDEARSLALDSQVLLRMIGDAALENQARDLGLGVAGKAVVARLKNDPLFKDSSGNFSQQRFYQILLRNSLSEQELLERQRRSLIIEQISGPVTGGVYVPDVLVEAANRYRNETRKLAYFTLPLEKAGLVPEPTEEQLREHYNAHKNQFRAPEYRSVNLVMLSPDELSKKVTVTDEEVSQYYDHNKERYGSPERREVIQIPFPDLEMAQQAYEKLQGGADFMEIARSRGLEEKDVKLGEITKTAILDETVADEVFKLPVGEWSAPIEGALSTVVAKVIKVEPAVQRTLDDERENIRKLLAADRAAAQVLDVYDKIEDERAAGVTLPEIAKKLELTHLDIEAVDRSGRGKDGKPVDGVSGQTALLQAIFTAEAGVETDPVETGDKGFTWYEVRKVMPERQKDFDEAKPEIATNWRKQEERKLLSRKAQELIDRMTGGETMEDVAGSLELEVKESDAIKRTARVDGIPGAAIQQAFALAAGSYGSAQAENGTSRVIFRVTDIQAPAAASGGDQKTIADSLKRSLSDDVVVQYIRALRDEVGVEINDRVFQEATAGRLYSGGRPAGAL